MKTVTGIEQVLDEMRRGAVLMANGCTGMLRWPDSTSAFVNRGTLRAILKRSALFVITRSGPSELQYVLLESLVAWIPVEERLPDDNRNVLVYTGEGERRFGYFDRDSDLWFCCCEMPAVTHWMELPPPPSAVPSSPVEPGQ